MLLVITVFLIVKGFKSRADWLLFALVVVTLGLGVTESIALNSYQWQTASMALKLSLGPILIVYIRSQGRLKLIIPWWVYTVLPIAVLCFLIFTVARGMTDEASYNSPISLILTFAAFIVSIAYGIYALLSLSKVRHSDVMLDKKMMVWMAVLVACFLSEIFIEFIYLFVYTFADDSVYLWLADTVISFIIVLTLFVQGIRLNAFKRAPEVATNVDRWKSMFGMMHQKILEDRLFLQPDLRIDDLARLMESNSKYVSRAINEGAGESITNYLNGLRLDFFKQQLRHTSNDHINLFALAEECGFSSKSSFNRFFKLREGMTPSEYRDSVL